MDAKTEELRAAVYDKVKLADERLLKLLLALSEAWECGEHPDFWDELPDDVKEDIGMAIQEAEKGQLIPHEEAMSRIRQKYALI
jgi:hypothetical protein